MACRRLRWALLFAGAAAMMPLHVGATDREPLAAESGWRDELDRRGLSLEAVYTADAVAIVRGGARRDRHFLDNLDLTLTCRSEELLGWDLGTVFLYGLRNSGGSPSASLDDLQGADNIEAPTSFQLYEAWWQYSLLERMTLLIGLYDLNAEFDVAESAALFVNSSFGMGPDFALSGVAGPSIFPATSLGTRIRLRPVDSVDWLVAVVDGIPGDPDHPGGTHVRLDRDDGLLVATELGWIVDANTGDDANLRTRRRRIGRGWGELPYTLKVAAGAWIYTRRLDDLDDVDAFGDPRRRTPAPGAYVLVDYDASKRDPFDACGLSAFARAGIADGSVQPVEAYVGGGLAYTGLLPARPDDRFGFGVAAARTSAGQRRATRAAGGDPRDWEVALEWTYQAQVFPWLALQPDLQWIVQPGGRSDRRNAVFVGLRTEVAL